MATVAEIDVLLQTKGSRTFLRDMGLSAAAITGAVYAFDRFLEVGGKATTVQRAFTQMTHGQADAMQRLRAATGGLVSDYELMRQANQALTLGSADSVEDFAELARGAQKLGRALGLDTTYALESLSTGIARQSRLWLDNLGIIVSVEAANQKYAASIGKTVAQLTDAERGEAFRVEALAQLEVATTDLGDVTYNAADAWKALWTEIGNTRTVAAEATAQSGILASVLGFLTESVHTITNMFRSQDDVVAEYNAMLERIIAETDGLTESTDESTAAVAKNYGERKKWLELLAGTETEEVIKSLGSLDRDAGELTRTFFDGVDVLGAYRDGLHTIGRVVDDTAAGVALLREQVRGLSSDMSAISGILGFIPGLGGIASLIGKGASLLGLGGRLISGDAPGIGGGGGVANSAPAQGAAITFNFPPAKSPTDAARDPAIARMFAAQVLHAREQGLAF